jgi:hypothetical protein
MKNLLKILFPYKYKEHTKESRKLFSNKETETEYSIVDLIIKLNKRIEKLEQENIGMSNALYEIENRLDAKINNIHPVIYNFEDKNKNS